MRAKLALIILSSLGAAVMAIPAVAARGPVLSVTPNRPVIDDGVTIHINPRSPLPRGDVFRVEVDSLDGVIDDGYSHLAVVNTRSKSAFVTPEDDPLGGNEWEQGKAFVYVSEVRKGSDPSASGKSLGFVSFRFYGLP